MAYDLSKVKILIVDDVQPMLVLTTTMLGILGFANVHGARSADEAYRLFQHHNHDLVITDWFMEPRDGLDLIRTIRRDEKSPNKFVPIILMTGYSDQPRVEMARDSGVTEFLMKPYNARDMYARIVQIVEKPRAFVEVNKFFGPDRRRKKDYSFNLKNRRVDMDVNTGEPLEQDAEIKKILVTLRDATKNV